MTDSELRDLRFAVRLFKVITSDNFMNNHMNYSANGKDRERLSYFGNAYRELCEHHAMAFFVPKTKRIHVYGEAPIYGTKICMMSIDLDILARYGVHNNPYVDLNCVQFFTLKTPSECKNYKEGVSSMPLWGGANFCYCLPKGAHWESARLDQFCDEFVDVPFYYFK